MKALLIGNYGAGNLGDDALHARFLSRFPHIDWTVVSARPGPTELPRLPGGIRSLLSLRWLKTLRALRQTDMVVFGGGTLLTDIESVHACFLWWLHARVANLYGKPVLFAGQGVGPFRTRRGEALARSALRTAIVLSVRDIASYHRIESWQLNTKIVQTDDAIYEEIIKRNFERSQKVFIIIPRGNSPKSFVEQAVSAARKSGLPTSVLLMAPDDPAEQRMAADLEERLPGAVVRPVRTLDDLVHNLCEASAVITQRYHGGVAAIALGIPCTAVPLQAGDKLAELGQYTPLATPAQLQEIRGRIAEGERQLEVAFERVKP